MKQGKVMRAILVLMMSYLVIFTSDSPGLSANPASLNTFYVATIGNDSTNPGTIERPFATLARAVSAMRAGDLIYIRAGNYPVSGTITLKQSGSLSAYCTIQAYPGEKPVFDFSGNSANGFYILGSYWRLEGLEIKNAKSCGIRITGNYNRIEQCVTHHNGDAGLFIGTNRGMNADGSQAAYNQVINCDSFLNYDPYGSTGDGGNADGFACKLNAGLGNVFKGCRAWENSDDGWDLYLMNYQVVMENCWTWRNGDPRSFNRPNSSTVWGGNGNGFKVGGGNPSKPKEYASHAQHRLIRCVAFDMRYGNVGKAKAFDLNNNMTGETLEHCLAWGSTTGFAFYQTPDDGTHHVLKNCVAFDCTRNTNLVNDTIQVNNSWNSQSGVTADVRDYVSLAVELAKAPRQPDGRLPENGFARLIPGSDLIDHGADIGLPYLGVFPDLGPFELK